MNEANSITGVEVVNEKVGATMIRYINKKLTPNQLAKDLVCSRLDDLVGYWDEDTSLEYSKMTQNERGDVAIAIRKQCQRVWKLMGANK